MIPKWLEHFLLESDLKIIEDAVFQSELQTSGEIVPMIVRRSSSVRHLPTLIYLFGFCIWLSLFEFFGHYLKLFDLNFIEIIVFVFGMILLIPISYILSLNSYLQRRLVHPIDHANQSYDRALIEFYNAGLNKTDGSTGILLFISLTDHQVVVLADKSINDKINPEIWSEVRDLMVLGLKNKNMAEGLTLAIKKCGEILSVHFPIKAKDVNELSNKLIIKD